MDKSLEIVGKIEEGYKIIKYLGSGKFSTVYQAERQLDQKLVALKIIKIYDMMDKNTVDKCLQEVELLKKVNHPFIVKYLDSFMAKNQLFIAIEWADKGDVKRLIKKYKLEGDLIDESKVIEYTKEIASALNHMHERRIIHRDLKPANILIFSDGTFKLGDLGLGRAMSDETFKAFSRVGTPLYMAPEVINSNGYDFKSDNWSLGCVVYELVTLRSPFQTNEKISMMDLFNKINSGQFQKIENNKYKTANKIIEGLLKKDPNQRMELKEVIKICDEYLSHLEEKPKIDPFIIMDDIIEKLRLLNYEINFCKKFHNEPITKFYFACNIYGYDFNYENNNQMENFPVQFAYFYDLCNWLMFIINNNISINNLNDNKIEFKRYDKTLKLNEQLNELVQKLHNNKIKVVVNNRFKYGYGDSVCSVITQLCDKYLMNQNYIFKTPKFFKNKENKIEKIYDDNIILEDNINTNIGFKANTNYNFGNHFTGSTRDGSNNLFYNGFGVKKFISNSNFCVNNNNNNNDEFFENDDNNNFEENENDVYNNILKNNNNEINEKEWEKELERVSINLNFNEMLKEKKIKNNNNNNNKKVIDKIKEYSNFVSENINEISNDINYYNNEIEDELKKIEKIEKKIQNSSNKNIKENIEKIKLTNSAINNYEDEFMNIEEDIEFKEEEMKRISNKMNKLNKNENNLLDEDNNEENKIKKIKKNIDNLVNEIKTFDRQIGVYNMSLWDFNEKNNNNKFNNLNYNNNNFDNNNNLFDEELK